MEQIEPVTEIRNGEEVVVMPVAEFNNQYKKKRKSAKQKILEENDIDIKYLKNIQWKKREGKFSFKIVDIPSVEDLKRLIDIQESYLDQFD